MGADLCIRHRKSDQAATDRLCGCRGRERTSIPNSVLRYVAIGDIRKRVAGFEEIKTSARTVVGGGEKILHRARLMKEASARRLSALTSQLDRLRATTSEAEG